MKNIKQKYSSTLCSSIYFFLYLTVSISAISTAPYIPTENIALDCGSSGNSEAKDGRNWFGDVGSKFGPSVQSNNTLSNQEAPSGGDVPFKTAFISRSQFTYTFSVTAGQKFVRLYFYPYKYLGFFDRFIALFSVKAGPYTLLSNFTGFPSADNRFFIPITREFCINVGENQKLDITFSPSPLTDAYAFINGIEIVSMPDNLYYFPNKFVGGSHRENPSFSFNDNTALQMVYRLNVGGGFLSGMNDSGIFREWSDDSNYLPKLGVVPVNKTVTIKYTNTTPPYIAPDEIYQTARSMGTDRAENEDYNLTWVLPVESGFKYLVRLHFCEFQSEITMVGDRVFGIYLNNQVAEASADVIGWSGGNGIPVFKDYVVPMESHGNESKRDLLIALHPLERWITVYSDAILNGIEIFKINNSLGNLAVPNPEFVLTTPPTTVPNPQLVSTTAPNPQLVVTTAHIKPPRWSAKKSIAVGGLTIIGATGFSLLGFIVFRKWTKTKSQKTKVPSLPQELCRKFTLAEIRVATNNFHEAQVVGDGGFGTVYRGYIDSGRIPVAIKRLKPKSLQGADEFLTEIQMLSKLRHRHIVSLIGYCNHKRQMILVYDYMEHGTLRDHLYKTDNPPLPWKQRLKICIGAARGLEYLHAGAKHTIIHRDVKTTNILVDKNWVAKVSDFGLSKMGPTSVSGTHVSTDVKGTFGYLDPEYYWSHRLTEKSDVFAFGVVLFEVLCGRAAVDMEREEEQHSLVQWARHCIKNETIDQIVDPYLTGKIAPQCLRVFAETADKCVHDRRNERPKMGDVVSSLEFALELQEIADAAKEDVNTGGAHGEEIDWELKILFCEVGNHDQV